MSTPARLRPDRVQPVHGALLKAIDLGDLLALTDHQRRRHVRALHNTWGIAAGLLWTLDDTGRGVVGGGVAYDRCGRLLVLPKAVSLPSAAQVPEPATVVLRADIAAREPAARVLLRSSPEQVEHGLDIVLGTIEAVGGNLLWTDAGRRQVASAAPVQVAAGRVPRGTLPATGTTQEWTTVIQVNAAFKHFPVYVAAVGTHADPRLASAGASPPASGIATVEVSGLEPDRFSVTVRRPGPPAAPQPGPPGIVATATATGSGPQAVSSTPDDITWIAAEWQSTAQVPMVDPPTGPHPGLF